MWVRALVDASILVVRPAAANAGRRYLDDALVRRVAPRDLDRSLVHVRKRHLAEGIERRSVSIALCPFHVQRIPEQPSKGSIVLLCRRQVGEGRLTSEDWVR